MTNHLITLLCVLALSFTLGAPKKAYGISGIATHNPQMTLQGLTIVVGVPIAVNILIENGEWGDYFENAGALFLLGFVGFILLDEDTGKISFDEISLQIQEKLKITDLERDLYNSELEELNAVANDISINANTTEDARKFWSEAKDQFSAETFSVLEKILNKGN